MKTTNGIDISENYINSLENLLEYLLEDDNFTSAVKKDPILTGLLKETKKCKTAKENWEKLRDKFLKGV